MGQVVWTIWALSHRSTDQALLSNITITIVDCSIRDFQSINCFNNMQHKAVTNGSLKWQP